MLHCASCYTITGSSTATPTPYTVGAGDRSAGVTSAAHLFRLPHNTAAGTSTETNYSLGNGNTATIGPGRVLRRNQRRRQRYTHAESRYLHHERRRFQRLELGHSECHRRSLYLQHGNGRSDGGSVSIQGSGTVNLVAPSSGTYQGIAFFQDRALSNTATIANSGTGNIIGTYYFYDAAFNFTGATAAATTAAFVANTVTVTGSSSLINDATGRFTGLAKTSVAVMQ